MSILSSSSSSSSFTLPFSADLVSLCQAHTAFLLALHQRGVSLATPTQASLTRYVDFWLPLVASVAVGNGNSLLIPPSDIAWLWHCHRLSPARYRAYCQKSFDGTVLEAQPPFSFQHRENNMDISFATPDTETMTASHTRDLWETAYPQEPFFWNGPDKPESAPPPQSFLLEGFDLVASTDSQANFLWQVSGPHFADAAFLQDGLVQYYKFLQLARSSHPLVPTYQIDLVWHTHILHSAAAYQEECQQIRGAFLHHDDSLNDRTPGAALDLAFQQTCALWLHTYGESYVVPGGMYRGEPPLVYYDHNVWKPTVHGDATDQVATMIVAGASSTGKAEPTRPWKTLKEPGALLPPNPPSPESGVNSNKQMEGYVFGKEGDQVGYFSLDTKEAWVILETRLKKRAVYAKIKYHNYDCGNCLCGSKTPSVQQVEEKEILENAWAELETMTAFVHAKQQAAGPDAFPDKTLIVEYLSKSSGKTDRPKSQYDEYNFMTGKYTPLYVGNAAACGAGPGGSPAGCGGGACSTYAVGGNAMATMTGATMSGAIIGGGACGYVSFHFCALKVALL